MFVAVVLVSFVNGIWLAQDRRLADLDRDGGRGGNGSVATNDRREYVRKLTGTDHCGRRLIWPVFDVPADLVPLLRVVGQNTRTHQRKNVPQPAGRLIPSFAEEGYNFPEEEQKPDSKLHPQRGSYVQCRCSKGWGDVGRGGR